MKTHCLIFYCLLFLSFLLRITRDAFLISSIGPEITGFIKIISVICVFVFVYIQKKLLKKFSIRKINLFVLSFFFTFFLLFFLKKIPSFHFSIITPFLKYPILLLNHLPYTVFYIVSELLSIFVSFNFWLWNDQTQEKNTSMINSVQISIITVSSLCFLFPNIVLKNPLFYLIPIVISFLAFFYSKDKQIELKEKKRKSFPKKYYLIPFSTFLSGMISGIFDPFTKSLIPNNNHVFFFKFLSVFWACQSILIIIFNFIFQNLSLIKNSYILPVSLIFISILSFFLKIFSFKFLFPFILFCTMLYRTLKYSIYAPWKINFIKKNELIDLLVIDSPMTKYGKMLSAVISSIFFSFGFNWKIYSPYALVFSFFLSCVWLYVSIRIED